MKWITRDGKKMEISEMTDRHLLNALRHCQRIEVEYKDAVNFFNHPVLGPRGEYAREAAEMEMDRFAEHAAQAVVAIEYLLKEVKKRKLVPLPVKQPAEMPTFELVEELEHGTIYKLSNKKKKKGEKKMPSEQLHEFFVAGVKHHNLHRCFDEVKPGDIVKMVPEPTNKYDPNAIKLLYESIERREDVMIGYVPAKFSPQISAFLEVADDPTCEIVGFFKDQPPWAQLRVRVYDHVEEEDEDFVDVGESRCDVDVFDEEGNEDG